MKTTIFYLDTSAIGGYFDDEWKDATRELRRQREPVATGDGAFGRGASTAKAVSCFACHRTPDREKIQEEDICRESEQEHSNTQNHPIFKPPDSPGFNLAARGRSNFPLP